MRRWVKAGLVVLAVAAAGWWGGHWLYWRWVDSLPRGPAAPVGAIAWIKQLPGKKPLLVVDESPGGKRVYQAECSAEGAGQCSWGPDGRTVMVEGYDGKNKLLEFFGPFQPQRNPVLIRLPGPLGIPTKPGEGGVRHSYYIGWRDAETVVVGDRLRLMHFARSGAEPSLLDKLLTRYFPQWASQPDELLVSTYQVFPRSRRLSRRRVPGLVFAQVHASPRGTFAAGMGEGDYDRILTLGAEGEVLATTGRWLENATGVGAAAVGDMDAKPGARQMVAAAVDTHLGTSAGSPRIGILDLKQQTWEEITRVRGWSMSLRWSPDGERLLITCLMPRAPRGSAWHIIVLQLNGGTLAEATWPWRQYPEASWSPSGNQVAIRLLTQVDPRVWQGQILEIAGDGTFKVVHVEPDAIAVDWLGGPVSDSPALVR